MALTNPRNTVKFDEIDSDDKATFLYDNSTITYSATAANGSAAVGLAVKFSAADTVALATDGSAVIGKLLAVEPDGKCLVQYGGYVTLPGGNGATLTRGKKIVGAVDGSSNPGYIREVATGTAAELGVARGYIQNAADTAAVLVNLG